MNLIILFTVWLAQASFIECWSSNPIRLSPRVVTFHSGSSRIPRRHLPPPTHMLSLMLSTPLQAQNDNNNDNSSPSVLYNDDAFGLVFLSSFFVAKDYTFSAIFASLSFLAVILVQFGGVKFSPLIPGFVAIISLIVTSLVGNVVTDVIPEEIALPVELAACAISLVWGFVQTTRENEK